MAARRRPMPPNPKPKLRFTEEQVAEVDRMAKAGATYNEMAEYLGISRTSLKRHFRDLITRGPKGETPVAWTAAHRDLVLALAGFGCSDSEIAQLFHCDAATLRKHFEEELDTARVRVNAHVASALFEAATKGGNVTAMTFWLRARAGWDDGLRRGRGADAPDEGPKPPTESARRSNVRAALETLTGEGRESLERVLDELAAENARMLN